MEKIMTKGLDGTEYELNNPWFVTDEEIENIKPEQIIVPFNTLGIGTRLQLRENNKDRQYGPIMLPDNTGSAVITEIEEKNNQLIIKAVENTKQEEKLKYTKEIIKEIDFSQGLGNERFVEILTNVFTKEQLLKMLNADDLEILLFDGLMYLRLDNKAYRL